MMYPAFEKYRGSEDQEIVAKEDKHNNLKNLIEESDFYRELMFEIEECLNLEYNEVRKEEEELGKFIEIYSKHKGMAKME